MDKSRILHVGIGRAGNVILNDLLTKNRRYIGLFVNSTRIDLSKLGAVNPNVNLYLFPGVDGSGRNGDIAKSYFDDNIQNLADKTLKYPLQDTIIIYASIDGGTGAKVMPLFARALRKMYPRDRFPNKKINIIGISPDHRKSDRVAFENAITCWNEIVALVKEGIIDDVKYVDNSKRSTLKEINEELIKELDEAFSMNGYCDDGSIDDNDAKVFHTSQGYGTIIQLDPQYKNIQVAIDEHLKHSIFAKPNTYKCKYIGVSVKDYNPVDVIDEFEYTKTAYKAKNAKHNTIVLGGCQEPSELIEMIKMEYDELLKKESETEIYEGTIIDIKKESDNHATSKSNNDNNFGDILTTEFTSEEYDNLFSDFL
jgi:hypothetical protein